MRATPLNRMLSVWNNIFILEVPAISRPRRFDPARWFPTLAGAEIKVPGYEIWFLSTTQASPPILRRSCMACPAWELICIRTMTYLYTHTRLTAHDHGQSVFSSLLHFTWPKYRHWFEAARPSEKFPLWSTAKHCEAVIVVHAVIGDSISSAKQLSWAMGLRRTVSRLKHRIALVWPPFSALRPWLLELVGLTYKLFAKMPQKQVVVFQISDSNKILIPLRKSRYWG